MMETYINGHHDISLDVCERNVGLYSYEHTRQMVDDLGNYEFMIDMSQDLEDHLTEMFVHFCPLCCR